MVVWTKVTSSFLEHYNSCRILEIVTVSSIYYLRAYNKVLREQNKMSDKYKRIQGGNGDFKIA